MLQGCFMQRVASHLLSLWHIFFGHKISFQTKVSFDVAITFFKSFRSWRGWWHKKWTYEIPIPFSAWSFWIDRLKLWNSCRLFPCVWVWPSNHCLRNIVAVLKGIPCLRKAGEIDIILAEQSLDRHLQGNQIPSRLKDNLGYSAAQALEPLYKRTLDGIWFANGGSVERDTQ